MWVSYNIEQYTGINIQRIMPIGQNFTNDNLLKFALHAIKSTYTELGLVNLRLPRLVHGSQEQ